MLKNHLKIVFRAVIRHRGTTLMNVAGLAMGVACFLLILLHVQHEFSYDTFHTHKEAIFRLAMQTEGNEYGGEFEGVAKVPGAWGPGLAADFPEVAAATRFNFVNRSLFRRGETRAYESGGFYADSTLFEVFSFPVIAGDPTSMLAAPSSIVLTRSLADRYFSGENPLGQSLSLDGRSGPQEYRVTGVLDDVPEAAHFSFDFLISMASDTSGLPEDWVRNQYYTYLLLQEGASTQAIADRFPSWLSGRVGPEAARPYRPLLQPLTSIHLQSRLFREMAANADIRNIYLFSIISFFILLIACINYINMATARGADRVREVGVRKVAGAPRGRLIQQFLGESFLVSAIAIGLGVVLVRLVLPVFNELVGATLTTAGMASPGFILSVLGTFLIVGLVSGVYPAFFLSSFRPINALKGGQGLFRSGRLRKGLVVVQFAISALLLIATGVVYGQVRYMQNKDLGFEDQALVVLPIPNASFNTASESIKERLKRHPGILEVSFSANMPGGSDFGIPVLPEGFTAEEAPDVRMLIVDHDFLDAFGMKMAAGRSFEIGREADAGAYLINEAAAEVLGWADPIGKTIAMPAIERPAGPVVGVVENFHFRSLHDPIGPILFFLPPTPDWLTYFTVRLQPDAVGEALAALEAEWTQLDPDHPFEYQFFDEAFAQLHAEEERTGRIAAALSLIAALVACVGLFGLAAYSAVRRTKEIGIRKALGAGVSQVAGLLSAEFLRLVGIAFVIATPVAWYLMTGWLADFAYNVGIQWQIFAGVALVLFGLTLVTVAYQAIRAALADPVKSLRYE